MPSGMLFYIIRYFLTLYLLNTYTLDLPSLGIFYLVAKLQLILKNLNKMINQAVFFLFF